VSRAWHKVQTDWEAWQKRDLSKDDIVRLILDGTVVAFVSTSAPPGCRCWSLSACAATDRRCCSASRAWAERARRPGGHFWTVWPPRGLGRPELAIVDGAPGLEAALAALWPTVPGPSAAPCTSTANLLAHAPKKLHDEISADYTDMIYAKTVKEVEAKHKAFVRKCG